MTPEQRLIRAVARALVKYIGEPSPSTVALMLGISRQRWVNGQRAGVKLATLSKWLEHLEQEWGLRVDWMLTPTEVSAEVVVDQSHRANTVTDAPATTPATTPSNTDR